MRLFCLSPRAPWRQALPSAPARSVLQPELLIAPAYAPRARRGAFLPRHGGLNPWTGAGTCVRNHGSWGQTPCIEYTLCHLRGILIYVIPVPLSVSLQHRCKEARDAFTFSKTHWLYRSAAKQELGVALNVISQVGRVGWKSLFLFVGQECCLL